MKFTVSWLKEHLETTASLDEILDGLIGVGLEVEEVSDKTKELAAFKVAYVVEAEKHPNADKLKLCKVDTDAGLKQVVCGAPNARAGMKAIIALPGAVIPATGETLQLGSIRGQESQAMMC
ncbi:MAG: phenylalanine--tRNA ligase subunit beta, partial [Pseudomonadota bacterium]|nr:phenylalanine--tRNA ligase subunit beta [Pseudomonadota bacterium]